MSCQNLFTSQRPVPPEVFENIQQHLSYQDLLICVQVSKDWLDFFSSILWRTLDDSRLDGYRKCLSRHWHQDVCSCYVNTRTFILRNGEHIRHLETGWSLTMAILVSAPKLRPRICSLVLQNNTQFPILTRDQVASILYARQRQIGHLEFQDTEKVLDSCLAPALGDGPKYQRHLHARIFVQLLLQNASTLTKLHFKSKIDILNSFQSIDVFYKLLTRLPALNDLQVSGDCVSIVALKKVLPNLTSLHLITKFPKMKRPPEYFQNLLKPVEITGPEWSNLPEVSDIEPLRSLSLEFNVCSAELHYILRQFPSLQHISLALDSNDRTVYALQVSARELPLELYGGLKSFKITRYMTGQEWELQGLLAYLANVLPHIRDLETLTLPALFCNKYEYCLRVSCKCLDSVRVVKHVLSP